MKCPTCGQPMPEGESEAGAPTSALVELLLSDDNLRFLVCEFLEGLAVSDVADRISPFIEMIGPAAIRASIRALDSREG